jgi:hypothetical protein
VIESGTSRVFRSSYLFARRRLHCGGAGFAIDGTAVNWLRWKADETINSQSHKAASARHAALAFALYALGHRMQTGAIRGSGAARWNGAVTQ